MLNIFRRKKNSQVVQWFDLSDRQPPDREPVDVAVENGNVCHPMSSCYHINGNWFKEDDQEMQAGIEVYKWKSITPPIQEK